MKGRTLRGASWIAPSSNATDSPRPVGWHLVALVAACGAVAAMLHAGFRWPLDLPGRHGLEWMALLVLARLGSGRGWTGSVAGAGAGVAALVPALGFHSLFAPLAYPLTGLVFDGLCRVALPLPQAVRLPLWAAASMTVGGLLGLAFGGWEPAAGTYVLSHLAFGLAGGLLGVALAAGARRMPRREAGSE